MDALIIVEVLRLPATPFSHTYQDFITRTLQKRVQDRATLQQLLGHPFLEHHSQAQTDVASFVADILDNSSIEDELEGGRNRGGAANNHNGR
jgi:serine/threonine protein kinase